MRPKPPWKGRGAGAVFLEHVGEGPVGHAGGHFCVAQLLEDEGRGKIAVVDGVARGVGGAPFGDVDGQGRLDRLHLGDVGLHVLRDDLKIGREVAVRLAILVEPAEAVAEAVDVVADEIERDFLSPAIGDQGQVPGRARCGGATDLIGGIDRPDRLGRLRIKLEVIGLAVGLDLGGEEGVEVGFVPDFEAPLFHLGFAVAFGPVPRQGGDEVLPAPVVLGHGDVAFPPKNGRGAAGEGVGHETEFDEGAHADGEEVVVEFVDVLPVIDRRAVLGLAVGAHVVAEEAVEADGLESDLVAADFELALPVGAQALVGATGADAGLVDAGEGPLRALQVGVDGADTSDWRGGLCQERETGADGGQGEQDRCAQAGPRPQAG